jgi:hypothetical protein
MKPAFYRETRVSKECATILAFFFDNVMPTKKAGRRHFSSEIDFFPDTLESSHAYLRPVVVLGITSRRPALAARLGNSRKESPAW